MRLVQKVEYTPPKPINYSENRTKRQDKCVLNTLNLESKEWILLSDWLTQITVLNIERENQGTAIKGKLTTSEDKFWLIILLFHVSIKVVFYFVSWFWHCLHLSLTLFAQRRHSVFDKSVPV
jgi:hypothetical protein